MRTVFIDRPDHMVEIEIRGVADGDIERVISRVGPQNVASIEVNGGALKTIPDVVRRCGRMTGFVVTRCALGEVPEWIEGMSSLVWLFIEDGCDQRQMDLF